MLFVIILLFVAIILISSIGQKKAKTNNGDLAVPNVKNINTSMPTAPDPSNRFIRIRVFDDNHKWHLTGIRSLTHTYGPYYTPDDVLSTIEELKPNVLERFYSGPLNLTDKLMYYDKPTGKWTYWNDVSGGFGGFQSGTIGSFLVQSMQKGAPSTYMTPRLDTPLYNTLGADIFFYRAQQLYQNMADIGVPTNNRYLSLDNWGGTLADQDTIDYVLSTLYSQGWAGIGIIGGYSGVNVKNPEFSATWSIVNVNLNWLPKKDTLKFLHEQPNLKLILLYIDIPEPMHIFATLSPDREAQILENLFSLQAPNANNPDQSGFTFVYTIAQGTISILPYWNAKEKITDTDGKYGGVSIYEFIRDYLIPTYCAIQGTSSGNRTCASDGLWRQ